MSMTNAVQLTTHLANKTKCFVDLKKIILRPLLQLAVKSIEQEGKIEDGVLERISGKYNVPQEKIDEWYSVLLGIFKFYIRSSGGGVKIADLTDYLLEQKMERECVDELCSVLERLKNPGILQSLSKNAEFFPTLVSCKWRLDIAISSSYVSRILEPTILMEWTLSSGQRYLFELSINKFHLLRHTIANLLLKIQAIENNPNFPKPIQTN